MKIQISLLTYFLLGASARFLAPDDSCEPDCFCIPDEGDKCPKIKKRLELGSDEAETAAAFFGSLTPEDGALATLKPAGCQPYPLVAAFFQLETCTGVEFTQVSVDSKSGKSSKKEKSAKSFKSSKSSKSDNDDVKCAFKFPKNVCDKGTYALEEVSGKSAKSAKKSKNGGVTHDGPCGLCSGAQDLATNLKPTLGMEAAMCTGLATALIADEVNIPILIPTVQNCFVNVGLSNDCAFLWASNSLNLLMELTLVTKSKIPALEITYEGPDSCVACNDQCLGVDPLPLQCLSLTLPGSCDLAPCTACDEEASGPIFKKFAGRTRRSSGILADIKRSCSSTENIQQPYQECMA